MQFRDLKQQYQVLKKDIDAAMIKVATDCNFISGTQVSEFEKELAEYVGVKHCVTCANGTDALSIAMMAWGIGAGDAVFVPDFTFFSSGEIVSHCGATPVFVDVDSDTFNICPKSLEAAVEKVIADGKLKAKAVVAVDLFGLPADFDKIKPAKPLGCYGDGGAVFTDDDELAALMQSIRVHGKGKMKYDNVRIGLNSRLDTIQAAILSVKLKAFKDYEVADINKVADKYTKLLKSAVKTPVVPDGFYSSWAQYTIQLDSKEQRDELQQVLKEKGIPTMVYYPKPMHKQLAFGLGEDYGFDCSVTEKLCDTVLSLPMHPYLKDDEIETVAGAVKDFLK